MFLHDVLLQTTLGKLKGCKTIPFLVKSPLSPKIDYHCDRCCFYIKVDSFTYVTDGSHSMVPIFGFCVEKEQTMYQWEHLFCRIKICKITISY